MRYGCGIYIRYGWGICEVCVRYMRGMGVVYERYVWGICEVWVRYMIGMGVVHERYR